MNRLHLPGFEAEDVSYGFFGRQGGVSAGVYKSLNCRVGSQDDPKAVAENRLLVVESIGAEQILNLYQIHSDVVCVVDGLWAMEDRPEGDAMVTDKAGVAIAILTADCTPILLMGRKSDGAPVVAAAHAGWRGAVDGILENTVDEMRKLGAEQIAAAIGPCIAQESYEVGQDFYEVFMNEDRGNVAFFKEGTQAFHYQFDLPGYCQARLQGCGVAEVILSGVDTYANEAEYFSYRRTTHRDEGDYGGQISVVMIKSA